MRKQYTKLSDDQVKHINELLDECWGTRKIAAEVGTSRQLVNYYRRLRELGLVTNEPTYKETEEWNVSTTDSKEGRLGTLSGGAKSNVKKCNCTDSCSKKQTGTSLKSCGTHATTRDASTRHTCCQELGQTTTATGQPVIGQPRVCQPEGNSRGNKRKKSVDVSQVNPATPLQKSSEYRTAQSQTFGMVGRSSQAFDGPRILTWDVETLPLESYTWGLFDQNVGLNQIKTDWAALSIAAKWMHEDEVWYEDTQHKATIRDDKDMIAKLCTMLDEADIVVGQNVKKFDMRKIRARAMMHGLPPFKEPLVQDTMLMARSIGSFTSNKLEYLSANLTDTPKSKHVKFPGFELWLGVMQGNPEAWEEMREYNIQDVRATEQLYLKLRPWVRNHPNVAHYYKDDANRCPRCGSTNLFANGTIFRGVSEYHTYTCSDCGGHSRSRYTLNSRNKRKSLLTTI